jgi:hypothetical protein
LGIGTPLEEQVEDVQPPSTEGEVERAVRFEIGVVSVAEEEQYESVALGSKGDLKGRGRTPPVDGCSPAA